MKVYGVNLKTCLDKKDMYKNEQESKQIIDIEDKDSSSLIDKIINIFSSDVTTGLLDIDSEPNDSDWTI